MWGIIPILTVLIAFVINIQSIFYKALKIKDEVKPDFFKFVVPYKNFSFKVIVVLHLWVVLLLGVISYAMYDFYMYNATQISAENVVKSYYDALDFKYYEKAHSFIDPNSKLSISQFMLETSVADGILNSYAKLDAIDIQIIKNSDNRATLVAKTKWITPLEIINKEYYHETIKRKGKWYILPQKQPLDIPPDQFLFDNTTSYFKQGRRKITTQQTYHEDVLKQPELEILSAKLIQYKNEFIIIGELQNIDNFPADVVLKSTLYNHHDKVLATFNAKDVIKHKIMPKETTSFKVNFEEISWLNKDAAQPTTFNPNEFTPKDINETPANFDIQSAGNVAITDFYTQVALSDLTIESNHLKGTLFNYGIQEVTVPELLVSYYTAEKELLYVDHYFLREGVRVQRKQYFDYELLDLSSCRIILSSLENCYVNGLPNGGLARTIIPKRNKTVEKELLQKVKGKGFSYVKIEMNNYIGNPK
tara:strand:- start:6002 stop:7429 length:1428 start_codon:yes stop_codon:yes gene_type:complete